MTMHKAGVLLILQDLTAHNRSDLRFLEGGYDYTYRMGSFKWPMRDTLAALAQYDSDAAVAALERSSDVLFLLRRSL